MVPCHRSCRALQPIIGALSSARAMLSMQRDHISNWLAISAMGSNRMVLGGPAHPPASLPSQGSQTAVSQTPIAAALQSTQGDQCRLVARGAAQLQHTCRMLILTSICAKCTAVTPGQLHVASGAPRCPYTLLHHFGSCTECSNILRLTRWPVMSMRCLRPTITRCV